MEPEYLCLTVRSRGGEPIDDFKTRLSQFWTHMLRQYKDEFEKVYAETVEFTQEAEQWTRQYLFEAEIHDRLTKELSSAGVDFEPIDPDDIYTKYEATPPDWMWIEH